MSKRLALIGHGKMGRALEHLGPERGWEVVAVIDEAVNTDGAGITRRSLNHADVALDFTMPAAAPANVRAAVLADCPIVVGTTGWYADLPELTDWVRAHSGALLTAANFAIGVHIFERLVAAASELFASAPGFDAHLLETHHAEKQDAPSGTALRLAEVAEAARADDRRLPVTSVRTGHVPGTHEMIFDAPFEQIRLTHMARDRRVFAEGALIAAGWLIGRQGVFTMRDVLLEPGRRTS